MHLPGCRTWLSAGLALLMGLSRADAVDLSSGEAPFGLSWGPVREVLKPTLADREGNITALIYFRGWAPATGSQTQEVVLEICRDEGLQQIVWFSRVLPIAEKSEVYTTIYREGVRRHGSPRAGPYPRTLEWPAARTVLGVRHAATLGEQIVMVSRGDGYAACSDRHLTEVGHPATDHIERLLDGHDLPSDSGAASTP